MDSEMNNKQLADRVELIIAAFFLGTSAGIGIAILILIVMWIVE